ncbi:MAG: non-structural maintenance of chromosomes element 1 family protein, partial [Thaumarchaeota archaeon]|nr:non-structural maintenance of chromosomes element 1 family protein [Nitrososphaerota archaeon]
SARDGEEIRPGSVSEDVFQDFIHAAREAVDPLDYDIRSAAHQVNSGSRDARVWAVINTNSDPSTQLATSHTPDEIAYIKRLLDAMFETYNTRRMEVMAVTWQQAVKLARPARRDTQGDGEEDRVPAPTDKGLKHSEVEALLPSLVHEGWLEKSPAGFWGLAPRALLELFSWLLNSYNDQSGEGDVWQRVKFCEACKEIVTIGQRCADRDCHIRLHDICMDAYFRSRRERTCPRCKRPWEGKHFVGERAVTSTEAFQRGRRRGSGRRSDLADAIMQENMDDGDEDEQQDGD